METFIWGHAAPVPEDVLRSASRQLDSIIAADGAHATEERNVKRIEDVLELVLHTAGLVDISDAHRAAACNLTCALLERCSISPREDVRAVVWRNGAWIKFFRVFLERSDTAKGKSMRQVLVILTTLLIQAGDDSESSSIKNGILDDLFDILFEQNSQSKAKPALQALTHFLVSKLFTVRILLDAFLDWNQRHALSNDQVPESLDHTQLFLRRLFSCTTRNDLAPAAGHFVVTLLDKGRQQQEGFARHSELYPVWAQPLRSTVGDAPESVPDFKNHLFPGLFKLNFDNYSQFLNFLHLEDHIRLCESNRTLASEENGFENEDSDEILLFAALQAGKEIGLVQEVDYRASRRIEIRNGIVRIPDRLVGRLLAHSSSGVRLAALALLVTSVAITRPFTAETFRYLRTHLPHLHAESDANFRSELFGLIQRFFDRLRAVTAALAKALAKQQAMSDYGRPEMRKEEHQSNILDSLPLGRDLHTHKEFIRWYVGFLSTELRPGGPYQRHISALRCLTTVTRSGLDGSVPQQHLSRQAQGGTQWPFHITVLTPGVVRALFDLLLDPFDDVRHSASFTLKMIDSEDRTAPFCNAAPALFDAMKTQEHGFTRQSFTASLPPFLEKAERMMQLSGRADHADGVARSYELLYEQSTKEEGSGLKDPVQSKEQNTRYSIVSYLIEGVEQAIGVVNHDLSKAVNEHPVHGMLASLKYILNRPDFYRSIKSPSKKASADWRFLHQRLFRCLHDIWASVRDILCNDAPEGHVPEDVQEDIETTTKDVLSYAWRALKEASALMRVIITKATFSNARATAILGVEDVGDLGKLCFVQLAELRHRGAFSTVAQTFASCCLRCSQIDDPAVQRLPKAWYEDALHCIRDKGSIITRRSAGMPALITGVLSAEPEGPLFRQAMDDLHAEAQLEGRQANIQETHLPQVHAMNCLKDIYTNTKLGQSSEPYLASGLDLAASRLESDVWAIRNCGLMLFRALIDRLLGSGDTQNWTEHDSSKASRLSYEKYPNLLEIMTRLLRPRTTEQEGKNAEARSTMSPSAVAEGVFPVLQILQRAPPPPAQARTIRQLVLGLTRSPHWHVRDMAARTYADLVPPAEHRDIVLAMLVNSSLSSQNSLHGNLLCVRYIVRRVLQKAPFVDQGSLQRILSALRNRYEDLFEQNTCPFTAAVFLEILNEIGEAVLVECSLSCMPPMDKENDIGESHNAMPFDGPTRQLAESFMHQAYRARSGKRIKSNTGPESSLFRQAAARNLALCFIMVLYPTALTQQSGADSAVKDLRNLMSDSAETDTDSCCAVVEHLGKILGCGRDARLLAIAQHVVPLFFNVLETTRNDEVKAVLQSVLADLINSIGAHHLPLTPAKDSGRNSSSANRATHTEPPSLYENSLRLQGPFLDSKLRGQAQWTTELADETQRLVRQIRCALEESNAFPIRYAAVSSLNSMRRVWRTPDPSNHAASALLNLMLVTYDALNDDDDEIRDIATKVVTRIIAGPRYRDGMKDVVPLVASQRLSEYLVKTYPDSRDLCEEAIHRVMGSDGSVSPLDVLEQAQRNSTTLFVQEKQNLFVDDVREVVIWSRVLKSLSDEAVTRSRAAYFSKWIWSGLSVFMDAAKAQGDGPLGWTSKPEVFAIGMRLIYGAEVLLHWRGRKSRKGSFEASKVRRLLREFADVGEANEVHKLWLQKIETVLADSVVERLGVMKAKLCGVVGNVC